LRQFIQKAKRLQSLPLLPPLYKCDETCASSWFWYTCIPCVIWKHEVIYKTGSGNVFYCRQNLDMCFFDIPKRTERQTDRQTSKQINRQTNRLTRRNADHKTSHPYRKRS